MEHPFSKTSFGLFESVFYNETEIEKEKSHCSK